MIDDRGGFPPVTRPVATSRVGPPSRGRERAGGREGGPPWAAATIAHLEENARGDCAGGSKAMVAPHLQRESPFVSSAMALSRPVHRAVSSLDDFGLRAGNAASTATAAASAADSMLGLWIPGSSKSVLILPLTEPTPSAGAHVNGGRWHAGTD